MKIKNKLKKIRYFFRDNIINKKNRDRLTNSDFTIVSSDCTGGTIYHDLRLRFDSPTINMFMTASDYIKFISNMDVYTNLVMEEICNNQFEYPVAKLGDIKLYLVHYKSVAEAQKKWDQRIKRVNKDNVYYIMNDRNNCSKKDIERFAKLPLKNKLLYTTKNNKYRGDYHLEQCVIPSKENHVPIMTSYRNVLSLKRNYDYYDYIKWLNNK